MQCIKNAIDVKEIDPSKNIYHCKFNDCDKFHLSSGDKNLLDAIYFLQIDYNFI